jgi:hypothetical protein
MKFQLSLLFDASMQQKAAIGCVENTQLLKTTKKARGGDQAIPRAC